MSALELQYKNLCNIVSTIDSLLEQIKNKAYHDADKWMRLFRKDNHSNSKQAHSSNPHAHKHDLLTNLTCCYQATEQFLKEYAYQNFNVSTTTIEEVFNLFYTKRIITKSERESLQAMAVNFHTLCTMCDDKGEVVICIELLNYYQLLCTVIKRLDTSIVAS